MKQHIGYQEFYNLPKELQNKLLILIGREDLTRIDFGTNQTLFNIGRMIEILKSKNTFVTIYSDESDEGDFGWWVVEVGETPDFSIDFKSKELVDALWDAIKEMFKSEVK